MENFLFLPLDIQLEIISYVCHEEYKSIRLVCKQFKTHIMRFFDTYGAFTNTNLSDYSQIPMYDYVNICFSVNSSVQFEDNVELYSLLKNSKPKKLIMDTHYFQERQTQKLLKANTFLPSSLESLVTNIGMDLKNCSFLEYLVSLDIHYTLFPTSDSKHLFIKNIHCCYHCRDHNCYYPCNLHKSPL